MYESELAQEIAATLPAVEIQKVSDYIPGGKGVFVKIKGMEGVSIDHDEDGCWFAELVDFESGDTYCARFDEASEVQAFVIGCFFALTK